MHCYAADQLRSARAMRSLVPFLLEVLRRTLRLPSFVIAAVPSLVVLPIPLLLLVAVPVFALPDESVVVLPGAPLCR